MTKVQVVNENRVRELLNAVLFDREILSANCKYEVWKSTYESMRALDNLLESELEHWDGSKELKKLEKVTNKFTKKIEKKGLKRYHWRGASHGCEEIVNEYRHRAAEYLEEFCEVLDPNSTLRQKVEQRVLDLKQI